MVVVSDPHPVKAGFKPEYEGDFPTLGHHVLDWMIEYLARPSIGYFQPFQPTREQAEMILEWYRLDPITGRRVYYRGVFQRSKGWGKAEDLSNIVPTPLGLRSFGDLRVGDEVYGANGKPTRVTHIHPVIVDFPATVYLSDGTKARFHPNHTFVVWVLDEKTEKYSLQELSLAQMMQETLMHLPDRRFAKPTPRFVLQDPPQNVAVGGKGRHIRAIIPNCTPTALRCITVEADDGQYITHPSGWVTHNSPFLGAIAAAESLADVRFDGWDANGKPVGRPWNLERKVQIDIMAVSEEQTRNAFGPLTDMMRTDALYEDYPGLDVLDTKVYLPDGGVIMPRTAAAKSLEGTPSVFQILDQTESFTPSNRGVELGRVALKNQIKVNGTFIEAPNAFVPGEGSFAEMTYEAWKRQEAGETFSKGILYDTRDWGDVDPTNPDDVREGLMYAYGDSANLPDGCRIHTPPCGVGDSPFPRGWVDIDSILSGVYDPTLTLSDSVRFFGNRAHAAADAFMSKDVWDAARWDEDDFTPVSKRDPIVFGFDGSWGRSNGITDATAMVAMRISDGLTWEVGIWEQPDTEDGVSWVPPREEIIAAGDHLIDNFTVSHALCDPAGWENVVEHWSGKIAEARNKRERRKLKPKSIAWRTNQLRSVADATQALRVAIHEQEIHHYNSPALSRHVLNATLRDTKSGRIMYKESPSSWRKIDGAYALMLANRARLDVLAEQATNKKPRMSAAPTRLR